MLVKARVIYRFRITIIVMKIVRFIVDDDAKIAWHDDDFKEFFGEISEKAKFCYQMIHKTNSPPKNCPVFGNVDFEITFESKKNQYLAMEITDFKLGDKRYYLHEAYELDSYWHKLIEKFFGEKIKHEIIGGYLIVKDGKIIAYNGNLNLIFDELKKLSEEKIIEIEYGKTLKLEINGRYLNLIAFPTVFGDLSIIFVYDEGGTKFFEERIKEIENYLDVVRNSEAIGVIVYQNDKIVYANRGAEKLTGYTREDLASKPYWEFAHESIRDVVKERGKRRQRGEKVEPYLYEIPFYTKSGEIRWGKFWFNSIIYKGKPAGIAIFFDITKEKRFEMELKEREKLFRKIFDSSPIGQYIVQDGKLVLVNKVFCKITGYDEKDLIGKRALDLVHPEDREKVRENAISMLKGERTEPYEYRAITKDGKVKWILETVVPIDFDGKKATLGNFMDITERKLAEESLRKLNDLIMFLNRILRHDLTNIFSAISVSTSEYRDSGEERYLDLIDKATTRGLDIINSIRSVERSIGEGRLKSVKLRDVLQKLKESYEEINISFEGDIDIAVYADDAIDSIFHNLVSNSIKHGNAKNVIIKVQKLNDECLISVSDDGIGIRDEIKCRIFDEGFSFGSSAGSGFGLYIVRKTVERYGGKIEVEDNKPRGVTFKIYLKVAKNG